MAHAPELWPAPGTFVGIQSVELSGCLAEGVSSATNAISASRVDLLSDSTAGSSAKGLGAGRSNRIHGSTYQGARPVTKNKYLDLTPPQEGRL
jgi:hypothetical protein